MRTMRKLVLAVPLAVAMAAGLAGCGEEPESAPASAPIPSATPTDDLADGCDSVRSATEATRASLLSAMEPAGEVGNTEDRSADLEPVVAELRELGEGVESPELSAAAVELADTVDGFRGTLSDIAVLRVTAQSAEAIVAADGSPEVIEAATEVIRSADDALAEATERVAEHSSALTANVAAIDAICG